MTIPPPAGVCAHQGRVRCWPCMTDECYETPRRHPWWDVDDVDHAKATGQPAPSGWCGCAFCGAPAVARTEPVAPAQPTRTVARAAGGTTTSEEPPMPDTDLAAAARILTALADAIDAEQDWADARHVDVRSLVDFLLLDAEEAEGRIAAALLDAARREVVSYERRCPVPCDSDCDVPCHEAHAVHWKREHEPENCPSVVPVHSAARCEGSGGDGGRGCWRKIGFATREHYCRRHGREAGWPCTATVSEVAE